MRLPPPLGLTPVLTLAASLAVLVPGCRSGGGGGGSGSVAPASSAATTGTPRRGATPVGGGTQPISSPTSPAQLPTPPASSAWTLRFDGLGYLPHGERWAVLLSQGAQAPGYRIYDQAAQQWVGGGATAGPRVLDVTSRAGTRLTGDLVDLSAIPGPGTYLVVLDDGSQQGPIDVGDQVYARAIPTLLQFFAAQRCGAAPASGAIHASCHLFGSIAGGAFSGDGIAVDEGYAGSVDATTGPAVDVEGGWHDAGDFCKFVGTTAFTLSVQLLAVRDHASALASAPAGSSKDALRTELRWGLDWLAKMVGGAALYHQVSGQPDHDQGFRSPEDDTQTPVSSGGVTYTQRPAIRFGAGQGANLLGRSAAAFALASQVYADDPPYAANLLALAKSMYAQGQARPAVQNPDPADWYAEKDWQDDMAFGAAVLAQTTGNATYAQDALGYARKLQPSPGTPIGWNSSDALAYLETGLAFPAGSPERQEMQADLDALAAPILASNRTPTGPAAAFRYALPSMDDGSLAQSLGAAVVALADAKLSGSPDALEVARSQLHWLFGQNPFGLSFMTGLASIPTRGNAPNVAGRPAPQAMPDRRR